MTRHADVRACLRDRRLGRNFRHVGGDALNRNLLEALNVSGQLYLTHTTLDGRFTLRMSIGQAWTQESHVVEAWKTIQKTAIEIEPTV